MQKTITDDISTEEKLLLDVSVKRRNNWHIEILLMMLERKRKRMDDDDLHSKNDYRLLI